MDDSRITKIPINLYNSSSELKTIMVLMGFQKKLNFTKKCPKFCQVKIIFLEYKQKTWCTFLLNFKCQRESCSSCVMYSTLKVKAEWKNKNVPLPTVFIWSLIWAKYEEEIVEKCSILTIFFLSLLLYTGLPTKDETVKTTQNSINMTI